MPSVTDFEPKGTISEVRVHAGLYLDILNAGRSPNAVRDHAGTAQVNFEVDRPPPVDSPPGDLMITMVNETVILQWFSKGWFYLRPKQSGGPGPSLEKFFILRWLKPHFFNSECSESGMTRNRKMVKTSPLHCDLSSRRSVCRWNIKSVNHRMIIVRYVSCLRYIQMHGVCVCVCVCVCVSA